MPRVRWFGWFILAALAAMAPACSCGSGETPPAAAPPPTPAITALEQQVAAGSADHLTLGKLGDEYAAAGQLDAARRQYTAAILLNPLHPEWIEKLKQLDGDFTPIIVKLQADLAANPKSDEAEGVLGKLLVKIGRPDEGIPHLLAALALDPADIEWCDLLLEHGADPKAILPILDAAQAANLEEAEYWGNCAKVRRATGDLAGAREAVARALALEPDDVEWLQFQAGL